MNADISGNAMPGNVSIDSDIQIIISEFPFSLKIKTLQMRQSNIKFFIYKAKCLNLTLDYHKLQNVFIKPVYNILEVD